MTDKELKPCPFCGIKASAYEDYVNSSAWEISCFNSACRVEPYVCEKTKTEAIAAWNTRAGESHD